MKPYLLFKRHFEKKKKDRASFSLRYLAKRMKVSPALISQMLSGKRNISLEAAEQFCEFLDIDQEARDGLLGMMLKEKGLTKAKASLIGSVAEGAEQRAEWQLANKKTFRLLNPWHVIAVADATLLKGYNGTEEWIAKRLSLSLNEVEKSFAMLKEEGLLIKKEGKWKKTSRFVEFSSSTTDEIRAFHKGQIENALAALSDASIQARENRLITGLIVTGSRKEIEWAKQALLKTMHEVVERLSSSKAEELFQLSIQFFPLALLKEDN